MRIEGAEFVTALRSAVWRGIHNAALLRSCTPGLVKLDETQSNHFDAVLELSSPTLSGRFEGTVDILERDVAQRLKLRVKGEGEPGSVDGTAELHLLDADQGRTRVRYIVDVQVGGSLARLGQRKIYGVAKELADQFFESFERDLPRPTPASSPRTPATEAAPATSAKTIPAAEPKARPSRLQMLLRKLGLSRHS